MGDKPSKVSLPVLDICKNGAAECHCDRVTRGIGPYFNAEMKIRDFLEKFWIRKVRPSSPPRLLEERISIEPIAGLDDMVEAMRLVQDAYALSPLE